VGRIGLVRRVCLYVWGGGDNENRGGGGSQEKVPSECPDSKLHRYRYLKKDQRAMC